MEDELLKEIEALKATNRELEDRAGQYNKLSMLARVIAYQEMTILDAWRGMRVAHVKVHYCIQRPAHASWPS
jgi:hypothetical protein